MKSRVWCDRHLTMSDIKSLMDLIQTSMKLPNYRRLVFVDGIDVDLVQDFQILKCMQYLLHSEN